jgi:hypothetical protein
MSLRRKAPRQTWFHETCFRRTRLYRNALWAVISAAVLALVPASTLPLQGQVYGHKQAVDKGPRALALLHITSSGKARLIPVVIMMDGKFYDAGSYKATPVPMALDFGVVYEGLHTGISQGTFTITQPGQLEHTWIAEGTWVPTGTKGAETSKKYAAPVIDDGSKDDRPVLHRAPGSTDKDEAKPAAPAASTTAPSASTGTATTSGAPSTPSTASSSGSTSSSSTAPPSAPTPSAPVPSASAPKDPKDAGKPAEDAAPRRSSTDENISDPNRPLLRRGKPDPSAHHEPFVNFDDPIESAKAARDAAASNPAIQTVTAISDAAGPDPRPYTYELKPAEEAIYRNKMLELVSLQLQPKTQQAVAPKASAAGEAGARKKPSAAKAASPLFDDLSLRIFDLSNSNEPVLVLSAKTHPAATGANGSIPEAQEVTLIARTNLEGELQKLFFSRTDSKHLDARPRMELIDAVDADGDGRGELLFRRTFDSGSAYGIYRVTADGLWTLYEGEP